MQRLENQFTDGVEIKIQPPIDANGEQSNLTPEWLVAAARELKNTTESETDQQPTVMDAIKLSPSQEKMIAIQGYATKSTVRRTEFINKAARLAEAA